MNPRVLKRSALTLVAVATVTVLILTSRFDVEAQYVSEYEKYVHTYLGSEPEGNWTYLEKPVFPVMLNDSQVSIGGNWSIVCPLLANHSYHAYCYGKWIDNGSTPKTDYDIYVYNSLGDMETYHTEAAGLPEHLGTTVDDPFFVPRYTGNYTFVIVNDPRESKGAQEATFMIIEDVECNAWHQCYVDGKDKNDQPVLNTSWAYEFATESQHIEVYVNVQGTLDMYEARLYLMSDWKSQNQTILNGVPLPWEPGLYANRSSQNNVVGGYNLESKEYRGVAYASCENYGQSMFMNYTSPAVGKTSYHLVLIGEVGFGTIGFLVKTEFNNTILEPSMVPGRVHPEDNVTVAYFSSSSDLKNATLEYSADSWRNVNSTNMDISNRTCTRVIPAQVAGTTISYRVTANDFLENVLVVNGSYPVRYDSALNFSYVPTEARLDENTTITGSFLPQVEGISITVHVSSGNKSKDIVCYTLDDGTFKADFKPETVGEWVVYARFNGSSSIYESESPLITIQVQEPTLAKYSYYIFGGIGAIVAVGMAVYIKKSRT